MLYDDAAYLRSIRTLTQAEVDAVTAEHSKYDVPVTLRMEATQGHAEFNASRH